MACGHIVWAMPPSPTRFDCLACAYLLHLALRHRRGTPGCDGDCRAWGKFAKLWLQHGSVVSFDVAFEQLVVSSGSK
eukprot:2532750-Amphidinium_carterae.1